MGRGRIGQRVNGWSRVSGKWVFGEWAMQNRVNDEFQIGIRGIGWWVFGEWRDAKPDER